MQPQLQSAGLQWPATVAAHHAHLVSASAPSGPVNNLSLLVEDQLELTERDLWEDDAGQMRLPALHGFAFRSDTCQTHSDF